MPYADHTKPETTAVVTGFDPQAYVPPEISITSDVGDVVSDAIKFENTVGSVARYLGDRWSLYYAQQAGWDPIDDDYDPFDDSATLALINERPELANNFARSGSRFESGLIRRRIAEEDEANERMANAGFGGTAAMLATGFIDPVNLLPVGAGYRALNMGKTALGVAEGAAAGFVAGAAYEGVLQGTQETRTLETSAANIAASTVLSGILGGGLALVRPEARAAMADNLAMSVREAQEAWNGSGGGGPEGGGGAGGAAMVRATTLADETRVGTGIAAERAGELPIVGNPMGRLSASPSVMVRRVARQLVETAYRYAGEGKGFVAPQAVETLAKQHEGPLAVSLGIMDHAFAKHRFGKKVFGARLRAGVEDVTGRRGGDKLTYEQFKERVGMAMRLGDQDAIPEVAEAAKAGRAVVERMEKAAIDSGLWSSVPEVKTAFSYLHRVYNTEKVRARRSKFEEIVFDWVSGLRQASEDKIKEVNAWSRVAQQSKANIERLDAELKAQQGFDIAGMRAEGQAKRRAAGELEREVKVRAARIKTLQRRLATAQQRQVKPSERFPTAEELLRGDDGAAPEVAAAVETAPATTAGQQRTLDDLIPQAVADRTQGAFDRQFGDGAKPKPKRRFADVEPVIKSLILDLHDARTLKEPQRIISQIRAMGGIRDTNGDLAARGFKPIKKRNGKALNTKEAHLEIIDTEAKVTDGRGIDQVAREMHESDQGFLPLREAGDEDTDALVDALESDAHGSPVYAEFGPDAAQVHRWRDAQAMKAELERQGIDLAWADERIAAELGLIDGYVPDTPAARERLRQAGFYERRVKDDLGAETKAHGDALQRLATTSKEAADVSGRAQRMRARFDAIKKERSQSVRSERKFSKLVEAHHEMQVMTDADLRDISRQVTDKVLGYENAGAFDVDGSVNLRGALQERTLMIPDWKIQEFLENDVETVLRKYTRQMGADVELARAFGRPDMMDQFDEIRQHYANVREASKKPVKGEDGKTTFVDDEATLRALDRRMQGDIDDLAAMRDRIRGTYGVPKDPNTMLSRGFRVVRNLNYVRLMGGATTASLADAGAVVLTHGFGRVFRNGLRPLLANLKGFRGAAEEVKRSGTALDLVLDTRAHNIAEIGDDYGRHSKFERGLQYATNKFGVANLLSVWTAYWKQFAGVVGQTRILEEVDRVVAGIASKAEIDHLAYLGIDYDMATRIGLEAKKHGAVEPGLRTARTDGWADTEAVRAIRAALAKEVDVTIVTPGAGDKPLWMSTEWGKVLGQFKSFSMSAMARTTTRGLQQRDVAAAQGLIMMITMGMMSYYLKTRDEDIDWENPAVWIKEGVDRSGVTGWVFEGLNTQEKLLGGFGINAAIGSPSARYASRNATGAILGPTFGVGEDALRLLSNIGKGDWSAADTHRIRKLLPAQNLFYLRWLFDEMEKGVNETFDVPDRRKPFRRRNDY